VNFLPKDPVPPVTNTTESCQFMRRIKQQTRAGDKRKFLAGIRAARGHLGCPVNPSERH
jgi:hypothetical protein